MPFFSAAVRVDKGGSRKVNCFAKFTLSLFKHTSRSSLLRLRPPLTGCRLGGLGMVGLRFIVSGRLYSIWTLEETVIVVSYGEISARETFSHQDKGASLQGLLEKWA